MEILGYILGTLIGITLGLIGSGGSILTVPILVYIFNINPVLATAYSLFIVGFTALVGGFQNARNNNVDFKSVVLFGIPSIVAVYISRAYLLPLIPDQIITIGNFELTKSIALMILFSIIMILSSISMIKKNKKTTTTKQINQKQNYLFILLEGTMVGILTGLVGAGGGFLIIPVLVILTGMPMKLAVGTSLFIVALKSIIGFVGDLQNNYSQIDWKLLLGFTSLSVIGIFIGIYLSKHIKNEHLKTIFGYFVLVMGIYILFKELFL